METSVEQHAQGQISGELLRDLERELHDLCQPVTALQCRLELGKICGGEEALLEAADGALEDAGRIFAAVAKMRDRLVAESAALHSREV